MPGNISCKDELNKGHKWYGPNRSRRYGKNMQKNSPKNLHDPANHNGVICREPAWEIPPMTRSCGET